MDSNHRALWIRYAVRPGAALVLLLALAVPLAAQHSIVAQFAAADLGRPGDTVPLELSVTHTAAEPLSALDLAGNQLFRYRLAVTVPPGQVRTVTFAPWYFDGSLDFPAEKLSLQPRRLAREAALVLFDPGDLKADQLTAPMARWQQHYFAAAPGTPPRGAVWPRPAALDRLTAALVADSPAVAIAVSPDHPRRSELQRLAVAAGLDLWTVAADGSATLADQVPTTLRRLLYGDPDIPRRPAWKRCVRPDLFDLSASASPTRIPEELFVSETGPWSLARRLRMLLPAGLGLVLLVCLAMLGPRWPRWAQAAGVLAITGAATIWSLAEAQATHLVFVDAVTVSLCDVPSGRTYEQHLAAVTAAGRASPQVSFDLPGSGAPRPLVAEDVDRVVYEGVCLARDLDGRWSARDLPMQAGLLMAFAVGRWPDSGLAPNDLTMTMQSSGPEVRLNSRRILADAWVYAGGQAWPMADAGSPGVYRAAARSVDCSQAAYVDAAPADAFRKRATRWAARYVQRTGLAVFFGWDDAPPPVSTDGKLTAHGRLVIYLLPQ